MLANRLRMSGGGGVQAVAVYKNLSNNLYISYDTINYKQIPFIVDATTSYTPHSVVYGNGLWAISTYTSGNCWMFYSYDGINWTRSSVLGYVAEKLLYQNGYFLGLDGQKTIHSTNGKTWVSGSTPSSKYGNIGCGNGLFMFVNETGSLAYTASDGMTWTQVYGFGCSLNQINDIAYGGGYWLVATQYWYYSTGTTKAYGMGLWYSSNNGANWGMGKKPTGWSDSQCSISDVCYNGSTGFLMDSGGGELLGIPTFSNTSYTVKSTLVAGKKVVHNDLMYILDTDGLYTSPKTDLVNWTRRNTIVLTDIAFKQ